MCLTPTQSVLQIEIEEHRRGWVRAQSRAGLRVVGGQWCPRVAGSGGSGSPELDPLGTLSRMPVVWVKRDTTPLSLPVIRFCYCGVVLALG